MQGALAELSQLGTILGQRYGIDDLQQQADSLQTQIEQTQRRIAQLLTQLENPNLSAVDRVVLQSRLSAARQKLTGLRETLRSTRAEGATSTVYLTLTTEEIQAAAGGRRPARRASRTCSRGRRSRSSTPSSSVGPFADSRRHRLAP